MSQFEVTCALRCRTSKPTFLISLTKEVNPERLVARPQGIATKWYTLPKSKTMSKSEPKEPKERKETNRGREVVHWPNEKMIN